MNKRANISKGAGGNNARKRRFIPLRIFTVIGFWPDSMQRFADAFKARSVFAAENLCLAKYKGVAVCGVLMGSHSCVDHAIYVRQDRADIE